MALTPGVDSLDVRYESTQRKSSQPILSGFADSLSPIPRTLYLRSRHDVSVTWVASYRYQGMDGPSQGIDEYRKEVCSEKIVASNHSRELGLDRIDGCVWTIPERS